MGLFLRVTLKNKFINGNTCLDKILELQKKYTNGDCKRRIEEYFTNNSVLTNYGNQKTYKVSGVSFDKTPTLPITVKDKDGGLREITLIDYYRDQYQKRIKHTDQPLFIISSRNMKESCIYLIPELCLITGMDEEMAENESLKKSMTGRTKQNPTAKMENIKQFKKLFYKTYSKKREIENKLTQTKRTLPDPNDIREKWGLNVEDFVEFRGRVLDYPRIVFKDGGNLNI
jgi:aubergine-like protein